MANNDMRNTVRGQKGLAVSAADMERGWIDETPKDSYEGSLTPPRLDWDADTGDFAERHQGIQWEGELESGSDFDRRHGMQDEYGFVRRPKHKTDVERY